jgi:hypothetical protein
MKRATALAILGLCTAAEGSVLISGEITNAPAGAVIPIMGRAYHTDPSAVVETPGGMMMYVFSSHNMTDDVLVASYPQFDDSPKQENWGDGTGGTPGGPSGVGVDNYAVRWEGYVDVPTTGTYTFSGNADDRLLVFVDGRLVYFNNIASGHYPGTVHLTEGRHAVSWWFREDGGGASFLVNENVPGENYTAVTGHPFASYALEVKVTQTAPVPGAVRWEVYDTVDLGTRTMGDLKLNQIVPGAPGMDWFRQIDGPGASDVITGLPFNTTSLVDDSFGIRMYAEIFLTAGEHTLQLSADNRLHALIDLDHDGFELSLPSAGGDLWGSSAPGADGTPNTITIAEDGFYRLRLDFYEVSGAQFFSFRIDNKHLTDPSFQLRSFGEAPQWIEFASGLTQVGDATSTGLLGVLDAGALGLPNGLYDVRLRVFDVAGREVSHLVQVKIPEPATLSLLTLAGVVCLRRR